ncbi:MAG: hypothetical protein ACPHDO_05115 [Candidatus Poseidoniaceae archaeon]
MAGDHAGPDLLFGFPTIFFGTLAIAGGLGYFLNKRWGKLPSIGEKYYDIMVLALGLWCLGGLLIDSFAHISGTVDDTFFTPWHAVWYSGATAYGAYIFYALLPEEGMSHLIRHPFEALKGLEPQHKPGVYGIIIFGISGFGDMIWHETLGVESSLDILLSPTHIGLFIGLCMSVSAPVWSAWANPQSGTSGLKSQILLIFGVGAMWSVILLMFRFANLWISPIESFCYSSSLDFCNNESYEDSLSFGLQSLYIQAAITCGMVLIFLQRWNPARGTMFLILTFHTIGVYVYTTFDNDILYMGLAWALIVELALPLYQKWGPKFYVPFIVATQVIVVMVSWYLKASDISNVSYWIEDGDLHVLPFGWTIHSTIGAVVVCATIGWLASVIGFPPEKPDLNTDDTNHQG